MKSPRFTLNPDLADTIIRVHQNGAFQIDCSEWAKLYQQSRIVVAGQRVADAVSDLKHEETEA